MVDSMKIIVIGNSRLETTCQINASFKEGDNVRCENRIECGGGVAGNIAYLLGKWGIETYIASMLGADDFATKIKKEFASVGVRTDYIETSYDKSTGQALILSNTANKTITSFDIASNAYLKKYSFTVAPDIIVTDGNDHNAIVSAYDKFPQAQSYMVIKRITTETDELARYSKFLILNQSSAEALTKMTINFNDSGTLVNVYNKLKQKYNNAEIVIMLGERGSVYSINSNVKIMPPAKMEYVDGYGAGEVYAGALIYGMANNFGLEKSIAYATIAASISTTKPSARNSIPSLNEVSSYYDAKFGAQNNPNKTNVEVQNNNPAPNMSTVESLDTTPNMSTTEVPNNAPNMNTMESQNPAPNMSVVEPPIPNNPINNNVNNNGVN